MPTFQHQKIDPNRETRENTLKHTLCFLGKVIDLTDIYVLKINYNLRIWASYPVCEVDAKP